MRVVSFPTRHRVPKLEASAGRLGLTVLEGLVGGPARARVHEVYVEEAEDAAAAGGFAMALAAGMAGKPHPVLWLRSRRAAGLGGMLQAEGWRDLGGRPGKGLVSILPDTMALLRAAVEGLRCPALGAVVMEGWGRMRELDLTASRRLSLAAEKSGMPLLLLRIDPLAGGVRAFCGAAGQRAGPSLFRCDLVAPAWRPFRPELASGVGP
jgi:protein ImuA